jgi:hypothetical protein
MLYFHLDGYYIALEAIMIITVISPDKTSLSMFYNFCTTVIDNKVVQVLDFNCLYDKDYQEKFYQDLSKKDTDSTLWLIKYKTKVKTKIDSLPACIKDYSYSVIKFDMYSLHADFIKVEDAYMKALLDRWEKNIERMNK